MEDKDRKCMYDIVMKHCMTKTNKQTNRSSLYLWSCGLAWLFRPKYLYLYICLNFYCCLLYHIYFIFSFSLMALIIFLLCSSQLMDWVPKVSAYIYFYPTVPTQNLVLCHIDSKNTVNVLKWVEKNILAQEISQGNSKLIKISVKNSEELGALWSLMSWENVIA